MSKYSKFGDDSLNTFLATGYIKKILHDDNDNNNDDNNNDDDDLVNTIA